MKKLVHTLVAISLIFALLGITGCAGNEEQERLSNNTNNTNTARIANLVIAANDSCDNSKAKADFVCDGINDDVEIQTAIYDLPISGGEILLLEGSYSIGDTIKILRSNVTIGGICGATKLTLANGSSCTVIQIGDGMVIAQHNQIMDIIIDGNKANQRAGYGIHLYGGSPIIAGYNNIIRVKLTDVCDDGIYLQLACDHSHIHECIIDNAGGDGISNMSSLVSFYYNLFSSNGQNGLYSSGNRCHIIDNTFNRNSQGRGNAYDGIRLYNAERNVVTGNICSDKQDVATQRYGISLLNSRCEDNIVTNNMLKSNNTGGLNDNGTNTVKANNIELIAGMESQTGNHGYDRRILALIYMMSMFPLTFFLFL